MAHSKYITSRQLLDLRNDTIEGKSLRDTMDSAGQTLWMEMLLSSKQAKAKLAVPMNETQGSPAVAQAFSQLADFHSGVLTSLSGTDQPRYPREQIHRYLSLAHQLQPESEDLSRKALEQGLRTLDLETPLSENAMKIELPQLLTSLNRERAH